MPYQINDVIFQNDSVSGNNDLLSQSNYWPISLNSDLVSQINDSLSKCWLNKNNDLVFQNKDLVSWNKD